MSLGLVSVCLLSCPGRSDTGAPSEPIRLSRVVEQLSQNEEVREKLLESLDSLPNAWGLIGPNQRARLRDFIVARDWSGIDSFPALSVAQLRASVTVANAASTQYPVLSGKLAAPYVEVGPFAADEAAVVEWEVPDGELTRSTAPPVKDLGLGLTMGDPPHPELWQWHAQSERAAYLFNRLALNRMLDKSQAFQVRVNGGMADSPEALAALLERSGYQVWIEDARYFANFGHLHFKGQDVLMPFWLDTGVAVPDSNGTLLVPVSHAEEEIRIRGARGNADVSFYYGIDGMAEFRTMDTLDQYWVGKNVAHAYRGAQGVEVARLLGEALETYAALHRRYPDLPFSGYYRLGVCQDVVAAIEYRMYGSATLFPITHDPGYFKGRGEIDRLFAKIPNDRGLRRIEWSRIRGSLPARELADIRIPDLRHNGLRHNDLRHNLELVEKSQGEKREAIGWTAILVALLTLCVLAIGLYRRYRQPTRTAA